MRKRGFFNQRKMIQLLKNQLGRAEKVPVRRVRAVRRRLLHDVTARPVCLHLRRSALDKRRALLTTGGPQSCAGTAAGLIQDARPDKSTQICNISWWTWPLLVDRIHCPQQPNTRWLAASGRYFWDVKIKEETTISMYWSAVPIYSPRVLHMSLCCLVNLFFLTKMWSRKCLKGLFFRSWGWI